jgi:hypothetical protein
MAYIIASNAIWAVGPTEESALAAYIRDTGDDSLTLDTISRHPMSGDIYVMPATDALIAKVEAEGGAISWDDTGSVADIRA